MKFSETSKAYVDANGIAIDGQTIDIGRLIFGPQLSYTYATEDGTTIRPHTSLKGIWDFDKPGTVPTGTPGTRLDASSWNGRIEAGLSLDRPDGFGLDLTGAWEGLGSTEFDAKSVKGTMRIPLN